MESTAVIFALKTRYPFGISRGTTSEAPTVLFRLVDPDSGLEGIGEGAPVRYKKQMAPDFPPLLARMAAGVTPENLDDIEAHYERARTIAPDHSSAIFAFDSALWDIRAKRAGRPLYACVGGKRPDAIKSSYTVSLSDHPTMELRAREAAHLPFIKVKLGRGQEFDLKAMQLVRAAAPKTQLRIDANAGWTLDDARFLIPKLADMGVDLIEQPLAIGNLDELKTLHGESPLPIISDEDVQYLDSLDALRGRTSGINIKLTKCGGVTEALRMVAYARAEGWKIFLGCMLETRLGLGVGAHLASQMDYLDLDGHMLTSNDPFPPGSSLELSADAPLPPGATGIGLDWPAELSSSAAA